MIEASTEDFAGLRTRIAGSAERGRLAVVLLHGYDMEPEDLEPFAHSLGVPALFLFPQGPLRTAAGGHAWWAVDTERRNVALRQGARDLVEEMPAGLPDARTLVGHLVRKIHAEFACEKFADMFNLFLS